MKKLLYLVVRRPSDTRPSTNNAHVSLFRSNLTFTKNDKIVLWKFLTKQKSYNGKNCNRKQRAEVAAASHNWTSVGLLTAALNSSPPRTTIVQQMLHVEASRAYLNDDIGDGKF
ncbi:hypothetical protein T08_12699 [Trichinella sp. T8]|nr:hypothetical protein T08_12699 [Trichinella sp. T8]